MNVFESGVIAPCKGCGNRKLKCHADCEAYLRWKEEKTTEQKKIHAYELEHNTSAHGFLTRQAFGSKGKG